MTNPLEVSDAYSGKNEVVEARKIKRAAAAALQRERGLLESVVHQIPIGVIAVDAAGQPAVLNDEARRIFGEIQGFVTAEDLDWRAASPEPGSDPDYGPITQALVLGEAVSGERFLVVQQDGTELAVELSATPVRDADGAIVGAVATFQDLSDRERAEAVQREFITNAAHELQSPLAAIVSACDVLQAGAKDAEERDLFLGHIERESRRLTLLLRSLLTLSRAQAGLDPPRPEVVELEPLLRAVADSLRPATGVTVEVVCPPDLGVLTNPDLLRQALESLGSNAANFTEKGTIRFGAFIVDRSVEVTVTDSGPGIQPVDRDRIFDRFYRGAGSQGFGLGLAIVRSIVDTLGGEIGLDTEAGGGTTVRIRLAAAARTVAS